MDLLNAAVQDANVLFKAAGKYLASDGADGLDPDLVAGLETALKEALALDTAQRNALRAVGALTAAQDKAMAKALALIRKARTAAKARYGGDKTSLKDFRVGEERALTVKGMITDLAYFKSVASKRLGDLSKFGFRAADLAAFDAVAAELERTDTEQELAKKAQKNATAARNDAYHALVLAARQLRLSAKAVFADRSDVLRELSPIKRAKKGKPKNAGGAGL
jgi:hypothetical protein